MTADLRRLAEQAAANGQSWLTADDFAGFGEVDTAYLIAANPQAILALLDRLDDLETDFRREFSEVRGIVADRDALAVRVAALEKMLLRAYDHPHRCLCEVDTANEQEARALLASGSAGAGGAAPSEPHVGIGPVDGGRIEEWPVPAALPAEVEE